MVRLLVLTILLTTLLSGCARNRLQDNAKRPDSMPASAAGKRVVINDQNGQPALKIRVRKSAWKVYDENLKAAGFVRWPDQTAPHIENLVRETLAKFQNVGDKDEVFELPGYLRIEKVEAGWAVFDQNARLLGLFEHETPAPEHDSEPELPVDTLLESDLDSDETTPHDAEFDLAVQQDTAQAERESDETTPPETDPKNLDEPAPTQSWTLRANYNTPILWTASQKDKQIIARHQNGKVFTGNAAYFSPPAVLAGKLDALTALERAALAAWFTHMMPDV